VSIIRR